MTTTNRKSAFLKAGYVLTSPRNQWSAVKEDGSAVAITVWADEITRGPEPWLYDLRGNPRLDIWKDKAGNTIRKRHVRHALDHCEGRVDLILCHVVDPIANPRETKRARPWFERIGIIDPQSFDEDSGTFLMELHAR